MMFIESRLQGVDPNNAKEICVDMMAKKLEKPSDDVRMEVTVKEWLEMLGNACDEDIEHRFLDCWYK